MTKVPRSVTDAATTPPTTASVKAAFFIFVITTSSLQRFHSGRWDAPETVSTRTLKQPSQPVKPACRPPACSRFSLLDLSSRQVSHAVSRRSRWQSSLVTRGVPA